MFRSDIERVLHFIRDKVAAKEGVYVTHDTLKWLAKEVREGRAFPKDADKTEVVLDALRSDSVYEALRDMQCEGWFNDDAATMRDLYAALRGTGFKGEDVSGKQAIFMQRLEARVGAIERVHWQEVLSICERAVKLEERVLNGDWQGRRKVYVWMDREGGTYEVGGRLFRDVVKSLRANGRVREERGERVSTFVVQEK